MWNEVRWAFGERSRGGAGAVWQGQASGKSCSHWDAFPTRLLFDKLLQIATLHRTNTLTPMPLKIIHATPSLGRACGRIPLSRPDPPTTKSSPEPSALCFITQESLDQLS